MKAEKPSGSLANNLQGGKQNETIFDDSFILQALLQRSFGVVHSSHFCRVEFSSTN